MKVLFLTAFSDAIDKFSGAAKSTFHHLRAMAAAGHSCLLAGPLVYRATDREQAITNLEEKGITVMSSQTAHIYVDRFEDRGVRVYAYTSKSYSGLPFAFKLLYPWWRLWSKERTPVSRHQKSFFELIWAMARHGSGARLRILEKWLSWLFTEPYAQDILHYLERLSLSYRPDIIFLDGCIELMEIADHLSSVLERKCKVVSIFRGSPAMHFGPYCMLSAEQEFVKTGRILELYKLMDGHLTSSRYLRSYLLKESGMDLKCHVVTPPIDPAPDKPTGNGPMHGFVTMINASNMKGVSILLSLARRMPEVQFAAIRSWGAITAEQRRELEKLPNIQMLKPMHPVDPIFYITKILLVPSLWNEPFGRVVVEAMVRGIPVIAADSGGLRESKLGVDYLLPVQHFNTFHDFSKPPPPQDVEPWQQALESLLYSREHYEEVSQASRRAAEAYVAKASNVSLTQFFAESTS